jgi:4-amino-4-deoxy-L-arabinose transferase-like glycosyltransferase
MNKKSSRPKKSKKVFLAGAHRKQLIAEGCFFFLLFCYYMMWARIQPLNASPDEQMRYQIAEYIYQHGALPHGDDPAVRDAVWGISYAFNPILDYILAAAMMKLVSLVTVKPFALLMGARLVSVLCGVGTVFFVHRIGKEVFDSSKTWLLTVFVAMMPGAVFVTSYVNSDSLALMSTAIIVYAWICGIRRNWTYPCCVGLSVGIGLCALSYYNAYGFILCSILIFGSTLLITAGKTGDFSTFTKKGALVTCLVLFLIGWWFIRNYMIYDGDFLGRKASALCAETYAAAGYKPSDNQTPMKTGVSFFDMLTKSYGTVTISWIELVSRSFVGRFGSLDIAMPAWVENNYMDFIKGGFLLVWIHPWKTFALRNKKVWRKEGIFHWCMLIAMIIPNILNAWYSYSSDYQPQGRYSLPMLVPLIYFVVKGYGYLLDELIKDEKIRKRVYVILCILLVALSLYVYGTVFWPAYRS